MSQRKRRSLLAVGDEAAEELIGGSCDGMRIKKDFAPVVHAYLFDTGTVSVYKRQVDGKLRFSHFLKKKRDS